MSGPLALKLLQYADLSSTDMALVDDLVDTEIRTVKAGGDLVREGDHIHFLKIVLNGWGCRYKLLENGSRQIVAFLLPGDLCNPVFPVAGTIDHSIGAIDKMHCALVLSDAVELVRTQSPRIRLALGIEGTATLAIQREWTRNVAARSARQRIGHLFCELAHRLRAIGGATSDGFDSPLTQIHLAEATGLSTVHVNRVIQDLRARDLIHWQGGRITMPDPAALEAYCHFRPSYLQFGR